MLENGLVFLFGLGQGPAGAFLGGDVNEIAEIIGFPGPRTDPPGRFRDPKDKPVATEGLDLPAGDGAVGAQLGHGTRAVSVLQGFLLILILYYLSGEFGLNTLHWLLTNFLGSIFLVIIILFQADIRKALSTVGAGGFFWRKRREALSEEVLDECILAVTAMDRTILSVALASPPFSILSYAVPDCFTAEEFPPGVRVLVPMFDAAEHFLGYVGVSRDITERRTAEEERNRSREFLARILSTIPDPVFVKDAEHRFVLVNEALCQMLGHTSEEIQGKLDIDFVPQEEAELFLERDRFVLETGQEDITAEPFTDSQGNPHGPGYRLRRRAPWDVCFWPGTGFPPGPCSCPARSR